MNLITQQSHTPYFFTVLILVALGTACSGSGNENTVLQRRTGETEISGDLSLKLTAGTFRSTQDNTALARSAGPNATLTVTGGPDAEGTASIEVFNLHTQAELEVVNVSFPTRRDVEGCGTLQRTPIPCLESSASIGAPCALPADCPEGLTCLSDTCQPSTAFERLCSAPEWERKTDDPTAVLMHPPAFPCTSTTYRLDRPETELTTTRFAVLGSTDSIVKVRRMYESITAQGVDFVVVLGENIETFDEAGIDDFDAAIRAFDVPTVYIAGEGAVSVDDGAYVVRQLGPHEFTFALGRAQFASFYSAYRDLGDDGLRRLENVLRQARRLGDDPLFTFTHTPPMDPNGVRDFGFRNRTEGAQAMSLLNQFDVNYLFAGRINDSDEAAIGPTRVVITTAADSTLRSASEYVLIDIDPAGAGESVINGVGVSVRRIQLD